MLHVNVSLGVWDQSVAGAFWLTVSNNTKQQVDRA